jgi:alanine racemase
MSEADIQEINTRDARLGVRTWIEIDTKAIENNYRIFRSCIKAPTKLLSVVKSNAYGHGLVDFSKHIERLGIDWIAVDAVVEAIRLRKEGVKVPILVLGYTLPERMLEAIDQNISLTISNMYALEGLQSLGLKGKIKVHIKVDTGMHRQGFMKHEIHTVVEFLTKHTEEIEVEGLYTHFAAAKDPDLPEETRNQVSLFKKWIEAFQKAGMKPIVHAAATGATIIFPETHFDMVRVGIGLHGLWPSAEVQAYRQKEMPLKPTMSWKTIISEIKELPENSKIGYDFTHVVDRKTTMAVCPIGYWHGYSRSLSNIGMVLVNGCRVRVIGRVSMDMMVIDITDVPQAKIGDEVVLIGASGDNYMSAHDVALLSGVSTYEFVTRINPLIKKIYL